MIDIYGWIKMYGKHYACHPYLIGELNLTRGGNQVLAWQLTGTWCSRLPIIWALETSECDIWDTWIVKGFKQRMSRCYKLSDEVFYFSPAIEDFIPIPYEELPLDCSPL